ncbi:4-alpha-glucanotransferase [bioreactor metagenome]|uniref:4-alpha-glucanotransferase n=1 Tax=bioreactor metagenome TaxID=1076179 RepID=A0A644WER8_9ZZZZ
MKILQFGFGGEDGRDLPHNYPINCVAYTGTHDNDTVCGWYNVTGSKKEIEKAKRYLNLTYEEGIAKGLIRGVWGSPAYLAVTTMQDFLGLGNSARMNMPSTLGGNWMWRASKKDFSEKLAKEIYSLTKLYGR